MGLYPAGSTGGRYPAHVESMMDDASEAGYEFALGQIESGEEQFHSQSDDLKEAAMEDCKRILEGEGIFIRPGRKLGWKAEEVLAAWNEGYNEAWDNYDLRDRRDEEDEYDGFGDEYDDDDEL